MKAPTELPRSQSSSKLQVFLCHSSGDRLAAKELYLKLQADGFDPWLDAEKLLPGQNWKEEVSRALKMSGAVLALISHGSINKEGYLQTELSDALEMAKEKPSGTIFIIPVLLEKVELPARLSHLQYCDVTEEKAYDKLVRALHVRAGIERLDTGTLARQSQNALAVTSSSFDFEAYAVGAAAVIDRPGQVTIPSQAVAGISPDGGHGSARVVRFHSPWLSFGVAFSEAGGARDEHGVRISYITSVVEFLDVAHVVTADRVVMRLTAYHNRETWSEFTTVGTHFENLRIVGYPVNVHLSASSFGYKGTERPTLEAQVVSLVTKIDPKVPNCPIAANVIDVPKFGSIRLAESVLSQSRCSLTMLRIDLHPEAGHIVIAAGYAGGTRIERQNPAPFS